MSVVNINWRPRDERLTEFVHTHVDSFASWDLVLFIHHNPGAIDTAQGFANRLGRSVQDVADSLERFSGLGCMRKIGQGDVATFTPCLSSEAKDDFSSFARAQSDRELRLMLIRGILQENTGVEKERP